MWKTVFVSTWFLALETLLVMHSGAEVHYERRRLARGMVIFWRLLVHSLLDGVILAIGFSTEGEAGLRLHATHPHSTTPGVTGL